MRLYGCATCQRRVELAELQDGTCPHCRQSAEERRASLEIREVRESRRRKPYRAVFAVRNEAGPFQLTGYEQRNLTTAQLLRAGRDVALGNGIPFHDPYDETAFEAEATIREAEGTEAPLDPFATTPRIVPLAAVAARLEHLRTLPEPGVAAREETAELETLLATVSGGKATEAEVSRGHSRLASRNGLRDYVRERMLAEGNNPDRWPYRNIDVESATRDIRHVHRHVRHRGQDYWLIGAERAPGAADR